MKYLQTVLAAVGITEGHDRWDSAATATLDQELESLRSRTYDKKYPELKAKQFIPVDNSDDPAAESIAYHQWDEYGMAELVANYADDLALVDAKKEKFAVPVSSVALAYDFTVQDLKRAALSGNQLPDKKALACRRGVERKIDDLAATGNKGAKLGGFLNHPNVTVISAPTDGTSSRWVGGRATPKSAENILIDLRTPVKQMVVTSKEVHSPNTVLLPTQEYAHISETAVGSNLDRTIKKVFVDNSDHIQNVASWHKLATADAAGTGPRMVIYQRDPEVLTLAIPLDFEQLPPQAKSLAFVVPTHARIGGVLIHYPLGVMYQDGI